MTPERIAELRYIHGRCLKDDQDVADDEVMKLVLGMGELLDALDASEKAREEAEETIRIKDDRIIELQVEWTKSCEELNAARREVEEAADEWGEAQIAANRFKDELDAERRKRGDAEESVARMKRHYAENDRQRDAAQEEVEAVRGAAAKVVKDFRDGFPDWRGYPRKSNGFIPFEDLEALEAALGPAPGGGEVCPECCDDFDREEPGCVVTCTRCGREVCRMCTDDGVCFGCLRKPAPGAEGEE